MDYYLDVHGLLVGIKLAPCNETGQIESFSIKNLTEQAQIRGESGDGLVSLPLEALLFSAFLSRAVLDFCALPPPMFDEEEERDRVERVLLGSLRRRVASVASRSPF
jgi:hypothetical protein